VSPLEQWDSVTFQEHDPSLGPFYPLLRHEGLGAGFATHHARFVAVAEFLADVNALAALLPNRRYALNLCLDRYRFAVGFAASLYRQQVTLLPPNETPGMLDSLSDDFPDLYCITDHALSTPSIRSFPYPEDLASRTASSTVPILPGRQLALLLFTSGSTGRPKPVARSWGALVRSSQAAWEGLAISRLEAATVVGTVPHQHSYGFESTVLMALQRRLVLHSERPFYPQDIAACLDGAPRPRILVTTPIHIRALVGDPAPLPPLDLIISATAPLSKELAQEAEARFRAPLVEIYGCSEAGQIAARRPREGEAWHCFPGVVLRQDEQGTWASGASIETETLLHDLIALNGPSEFMLGGRAADLVNVAGKRGSLADLNYQLTSIEGVLDGVFLMPEEIHQCITRLAAFVVAPGMSSDSILKRLRDRIDPAFLPRPLVFVDSLPRNAVGKLPREALVQLLTRKARP
jgi:acyl-coenzyme A synthetase/AMP-(fatty) acid ligase